MTDQREVIARIETILDNASVKLCQDSELRQRLADLRALLDQTPVTDAEITHDALALTQSLDIESVDPCSVFNHVLGAMIHFGTTVRDRCILAAKPQPDPEERKCDLRMYHGQDQTGPCPECGYMPLPHIHFPETKPQPAQPSISNEELDAMDARCRAATPEPWSSSSYASTANNLTFTILTDQPFKVIGSSDFQAARTLVAKVDANEPMPSAELRERNSKLEQAAQEELEWLAAITQMVSYDPKEIETRIAKLRDALEGKE